MEEAFADFGHIAGDVVLFGAPVSNREATAAFISRLESEGISPRSAICTGDVVAYCANPAETVDLLRAFGCPVIAGNCEVQLAGDADDCGCGFVSGSVCDTLSEAWFAHARASLGPDARRWMAELPQFGVFTHARGRFAVIHGGATQINRYIWPNDPASVYEEEVAQVRQIMGHVDGIVCGHAGIAFQRQVAGVHWINAGSIGMPPHDGRPETRYARLSADGVVFERLRYDWGVAKASMHSAGLTQGYDKTLIDGVWPSEDVLPPTLRRAG
ncbi:MAG: metallophosphoesterase family protein [Pseudomonadota bacterium]